MAAKKAGKKEQLSFAFGEKSAGNTSRAKTKSKKKSKKKTKKKTKSKTTRKKLRPRGERVSKRSRVGEAATAESMAAKQRDISVSEFFAKNRHLLGFDNPRKAL
jgi:DNA topoisomerase-6 subunit B